jgi:iron complex outermembrane receptor protein
MGFLYNKHKVEQHMTRNRAFQSVGNVRSPSVAIAVQAVFRRCRAGAALFSTATLIVGAPDALGQSTTANMQSADTGSLSEIVVTAQRRNQTVQDIPYNISVVGGADIANSGATNINDLSRIVNGLVTVDQGPAARSFQNDLTLRGLRTDSPGGGSVSMYKPSQTVNAVSTYFGETPIFFPMVLEDIERVEVLRGPQGTLYGSGAEAGTIRVIPHRPDLSGFAAEVSATGSYTEFANRPNDNVHGMLNIPFSDTLALRLVAGQEHLAGFIDAVNLWELDPSRAPIPSVPGNLSSGPVVGPKQKDLNSSNQGFGRAALRWKPVDSIDLQFDYLHQRTTQANPQVSTPFWRGGCIDYSAPDASVSTPTCAGASPSAFYANAGGPYTTGAVSKEPYEDAVDLGSVVANVDLGFANFTSATSYFEDETSSSINEIALDTSVGVGFNYNTVPPYNGYPRANFISYDLAKNKSFVQEVRLASSGKNFLDYVVGAFYQRETRHSFLQFFDYGLNAYSDSIGQPGLGDMQGHQIVNSVYSDKALFGELTAHITDAWQVTGGLRFFRDEYSQQAATALPLCGALCSEDLTDPNGLTVIDTNQQFADHLKKINTSYDLNSSTKIYVTYSEGFRRGGTNGVPVNGPDASLPQYQSYTPDTAKNYEVGVKGNLLERRVRYSAAVYRIDLTNVQLNAYSPGGFAAVYNGSTARTRGVELEFQAMATEHLMLSAGYTYTEAKTTAAVQKIDLVPFALIPGLGGTGPTDTAPFLDIAKGVRLPGVPLSTATLGVDYNVPPALLGHSNWTLLLHADAAYRSSAAGGIDVTSPYYWKVPSSTVTNARASLWVKEHLGVDLFTNNITSNTAYSGAANAQKVGHPYQLRNVARPRTVGVTLRYRF